MIQTDMRSYSFFTFGESNGYGAPSLSTAPKGEVVLAIYNTSQQIQDNINYAEANYIALTQDKNIDDTYVVQLSENKKAKVLYIQPQGRYRQVFLRNYD